MKGLGLNAGFIAWADKQADDDALLLKILFQAGCVFYVRITEPQTLVSSQICSSLPREKSWNDPPPLLLLLVEDMNVSYPIDL